MNAKQYGISFVSCLILAAGLGGCSDKTPAPAAERPAPASAPVTPPATPPASVAPAATPPATVAKLDGETVYNTACLACHKLAIAGAPKFGDTEAWAPRIAKGMDVLYASSINGLQGETGIMPPKGGRLDLSDDAIKAAVDYMVEAAK